MTINHRSLSLRGPGGVWLSVCSTAIQKVGSNKGFSVRGALKTAVNGDRNKVDSIRSYLGILLGLPKYMSSPFQNILRICKYYLFCRVLYGFMTSAKNRTVSATRAKNRSVSTKDQRGLTSYIIPLLPYRADVLFV